ncbi:MAG: tetratricopeptide repeat protein [Reichenbachiella sp.]|uniref:tetratricopeptide repeat protein n=1 Tax=Reichenbachiella sp. TaxID=2184521 RepID=UPI003296ACAA
MRRTKYFLLILVLCFSSKGFSQIDLFDDALNKTNRSTFDVLSSIKNYNDSITLKSASYELNMETGLNYLNSGEFLKAISFFKVAKTIYVKSVGDSQFHFSNGLSDKNPYPDYYLGIGYFYLSEYDSAILYFENSLEEVPYFIDAVNFLGNTHLQKGSIDLAQKVFQNGLKINNDLDILIHNNAYCYFLKNELKAAKTELEQNIGLNRTFFQSYFLLGYIEELNGNPKKAEEIYSTAIQEDSSNKDSFYSRAYFHLRQNDMSSAKADYNSIIEIDPQETTSIVMSSLLTLHEGNYIEGISRLSDLLNKSDVFEQQSKKTSSQYFDLELQSIVQDIDEYTSQKELYLIGYMVDEIIFNRSTSASIEQANLLLHTEPESIIGKRILLYCETIRNPSIINIKLIEEILGSKKFPSVLYLKAMYHFNKKDYDISKETFGLLLDTAPYLGFGHYYLGRSFEKTNQYHLAISAYTNAIENMPYYPNAYNDRGNCFESINESRKAIKDFNKTLSISTLNGWPYNNMGISYRSLKLYDSAIYCYNKALEINNYESPYYNMGLVYEDLEEYDSALKMYSQAIELSQIYPSYYVHRGDLYYQLDNIKEAIEDYSKCISLNPVNPNYYKNRGNAFIYIDKFDEAISDFLKATELDPNYSYAFRRLGDAYRYSADYNLAISSYEKALMIKPKYEYAEYGLAYTYLDMNELNLAVKHFTNATEIDPEYASAYGNMGWAYYLLNEYDLCIENSQKAVELDDSAFYARFNIALSTLCKGDFEQAKSLYDEFMKLAVSKNANVQGAKSDLVDLIKKKTFSKEAKQILKLYF